MAATVKPAPWGDDLRLPTFSNPADTTTLLTDLEPYRRTSQPFQSKHLPALKRNVWYALRRPADRARSGLLVVWPAIGACVYLSGEPATSKRHGGYNRVALLRLRVDPQFYAAGTGMTVFAATLSPSMRRLWVEDVLVWKGRTLATDETFQERWRLATQWVEHYCIQDPRLLGGLELELAPWQALENVEPDGSWDFLCADMAGARRLWWIARHTEAPVSVPVPVVPIPSSALPIPSSTLPTRSSSTLPTRSSSSAPRDPAAPLVAIATREPGPDRWGLASADGVSLGHALVRTLKVSSALRTQKTNTVRVDVVWTPVFSKWEIVGLSSDVASHSSFFAAAK
jgi:hypothetical protein